MKYTKGKHFMLTLFSPWRKYTKCILCCDWKKENKKYINIQANPVLFLKKVYANDEQNWWQIGAVAIEKARKRFHFTGNNS